jgi:predicted aspartyl protease
MKYLLILLLASPCCALAQATAASNSSHSCTVVRTAPTDGETALAREDYDSSLTFYKTAVAKPDTSPDDHLGLVLAYIGKNMTTEATKEAAAMLAANPHSAIAEVAAGDAAYRMADFDAARKHAKAAIADDLCEGRGHALLADFLSLFAFFASEAQQRAIAHSLRPNDEEILRDWIFTLPRSKRVVELAKYLDGKPALSERETVAYHNAEDHLKARHPHECHITSTSESVSIPLIPIDFDPVRGPHALGLEVALNGKKRHLELDTGASGILLSPSAARALKLSEEYHMKTGGVGEKGEVESYLTHVASIHIGGVELSDCMVEVLKKDRIDTDGLIGLNVFAKWATTLDFPHKKLSLSPLPPRPGDVKTPEANTVGDTVKQDDDDERTPQDAIVADTMKDWVHIVRIGHGLLLPSSLNNKIHGYMLVDTGAGQTSLSTDFAKGAGKLYENPNVRFSGISGEVKKTMTIDNVGLQFGNLRLPETSYFAFDITNVSHDFGAELSGFVGIPTLARLTISIDYRDNLASFKYDPKNDPAIR